MVKTSGTLLSRVAFVFTMEQITKELALASLMPAIAAKNIQQLLDESKKSVITKETLAGTYELMLKLREAYYYLDERKDADDKADKERIAARKAAYDVYMKPIKEVLEKAEPEFVKLNYAIKKEERERQGEIDKKNEVRQRHIDFVNGTIKSIISASDNKELAKIQMLIGTEKSRSKFYENYEPIKKSCELLLGLIDERKKIMKDNIRLESEYQKAIAGNDLPKATHIREEIEYGQKVISENAINIAEDAYKQVADVSLINSELPSMAIRPRLHRWSWRVDDIDLLYRKMPELVELQPNKKTIKEFMDGQPDLNEEEDNSFHGLVIFRKPYFVEPSK